MEKVVEEGAFAAVLCSDDGNGEVVFSAVVDGLESGGEGGGAE